VPSRAKSVKGAAKPKAKKAPAKKRQAAAEGGGEAHEGQERPTPGASPGKLVVKQVKSGIGHAQTYRRTLRALGLRHHQAEIVVRDNPSIRGMLTKVHHLVSVRPQGA
jgi:large subunit ribosomal protein L30